VYPSKNNRVLRICRKERKGRKLFESPELSAPDITPAKAQSRQVQKGNVNIFTNELHYFVPTFAALASLPEIFRDSVAALLR
jgi:hypothetical protein